ncbi:perilipin-2-like isoform X4 [Mugil cephalus]|uniref:perilipin-2-like isoform X4 n=1 Tax=Mugil cephalus TaxID=48193 RepID=UPI001FB70DC8|nr:perilipin-2-like isoform X4 [Mugil cephalus]
MPKNNNQKAPSAAARLGRLPLVRSACAKLSVLYTSAKGSHPSLRSACDVLESSVTVVGRSACCRVLPAIAQLEPQISIANDVACKSLDWLEASFPLLLSPTDQIVATAKNKVHEIQDVVSTAAIGAVYCVQNTVTWVMSRVHQVDGGGSQSLVQRTICVVGVGLDSALSWSEALLDQVLPPSEEDEGGDTRLVVGFEATTLRSHYPARLVSLTVKLCRRTYCTVGSKIQPVQVCCHGEFIQVLDSGSGSSDQLSGPGVHSPRAAPVLAASGYFCVFLCHPDAQNEQPSIPTGAV